MSAAKARTGARSAAQGYGRSLERHEGATSRDRVDCSAVTIDDVTRDFVDLRILVLPESGPGVGLRIRIDEYSRILAATGIGRKSAWFAMPDTGRRWVTRVPPSPTCASTATTTRSTRLVGRRVEVRASQPELIAVELDTGGLCARHRRAFAGGAMSASPTRCSRPTSPRASPTVAREGSLTADTTNA